MSPLHRRWNSKATPSTSTSNMCSPLVNRTNTQKSAYSTTTAATGATGMSNTTFLPEFHSTPPMPTLQKPHSAITGTPTPLRTNTTSCSMAGYDTTPTENIFLLRQKSASGCSHHRSASPRTRRCKATIDVRDRLPNTPELPEKWSPLHDRAMCILDTRGYTHEAIVKKLKSTFVELQEKCLTPVMIDKQLRILDQKPEIPYWRVGLATLTSAEEEKEEEKKKKKKGQGRALTPKTAGSTGDNQSPSELPRRSTEAVSASSATKNSTRSLSKISRKDTESALHGKDSTQDLYVLMAHMEAKELAKTATQHQEEQENWKPHGPRAKGSTNSLRMRQPLAQISSGPN
ncbi:hypothetical protein DOTSEDRAFT_125148 [Dothistroma septosporum NZE10]|uniref:Uncharacterized protein n=1 Tax=Dothistroma septosporum (strain NZE10 / CBS 128990) TaxID=675120 RepID=N1PWT7_DOTSN|nr:hypothetical protein DOTSEDRAFT_125148 [Dothistroma septosporum NZE10]